ncbi:hypothetical protein KO561_14290 [Radiobacillus kanasensis]|uniref:hypothetical protein n=1 Tax=Radiobacillus kanasensis TaxID=2844358 RepID=UPI001E3166A7|nr:hypothetical protein [Radiobacillus kanasensis]UFT98363.1 hypothetical protein KO561_14290 [Radiobacillus kanasensis]
MNQIDFAVLVYVVYMIATTFGSYKYGAFMIRKTGILGSQIVVAGAINLVIGILGIVGWSLFSWGVNEFLYVLGIALGIALLFVGELILVIIFLLRRKKLLQDYENTNT